MSNDTATPTADNSAPLASLRDVAAYFRRDGETLSHFSAEWKALTEQDRHDLRAGIGNGTFTY